MRAEDNDAIDETVQLIKRTTADESDVEESEDTGGAQDDRDLRRQRYSKKRDPRDG